MTDNEKRAHDIAVAYMSVTLDHALSGQKIDSKSKSDEINLDVYEIYKKVYENVLQSLNRDFN